MNVRLEELREKHRHMSQEMEAIRAEILELEIQETGVSVGSIVTVSGKEFKVSKVEPRAWGGKPWLWGMARLKDGRFSHYPRKLYNDWKKA